MLISMSAATSNATCITAGTLLHKGVDLHGSTAPPSPIGFEATMSVAMELETTLKAESSDQYSPQPSPIHLETSEKIGREYPEESCSSEPSDGKESTTDKRHVGNGHVSSTSLNDRQRPSNDTSPPIQEKQLDMLHDNTDVIMDGDLIDDEDDDSNGHSSGSEGHCSYGDISVDTSKEDDMDEDLDPLHKLQSSLERNGLHAAGVGNGPNERPDSGEGDYYEGGCNDSSQLTSLHYQHHGQLYQCHLCSFSAPSKFHFNSHLNTHYDHKCGLCDYRSRTEGRLKRHMKDFHSDLAPETVSEKSGKIKGDGSNGQSKSKTYRCKQCSYVATIKAEFWAHSKSHIKAEKLLTCPRCPFVTEYKHHLEYHLRNHFGSKPFRCPKCSYSCVNKSMLNSHMKSHSNVYQYRCADCTYATKYCHSLKLHLRKYTHTPATVLNLDGTPNPMPIIDVYGTRRGPRVKKNRTDLYANDSNPGSNGNGGGPLPFSPLQVPMNGSGLAPATLPFFYSGDGPNGFHASPDGLLQHSGANISKPLPHPNNHIKEEPTENGRQINNGGSGGGGSFKCNLCDFLTDHNEMFSKHMLLHAAAENQDLCNLYGINSESILQDPNQQQHSQMNVATMAAVAAALGFGGHHPMQLSYHNHRGGSGSNGLHHRQAPSAQQSPQQQETRPSSQGSQESGPAPDLHTSPVAGQRGTKLALKLQNDDGASTERENGPTNTSGSQHPLEHLRAFSEHVNIQPFTMRDLSSQLFPSDASVPHLHIQTSGLVNTAAEEGHRTGNVENVPTEKFVNSPNGLPAKYSPPSQQPTTKKAKTSATKSPKREVVVGFGPLDLSSAKLPSRHGGQYLDVHPLHHHHQSPFQHFSMQQHLQRSQQLSLAALQQQRFAQQHVSTTSQEFADAVCQLSPPAQGQPLPDGPQQQQPKHRRKGKAFKLDRICMKLQKEKGSSPPGGQQVLDDAEESGDEISREDYGRDEEPGQMQQQPDEGTPKQSTLGAPIQSSTSPKPPPLSTQQMSPPVQNKVLQVKDGMEDTNGKEDAEGGGAGWKEAYQCQYCDMAFKDCIMYTVHMGYHGFKDPFKCNMCGQQTKDKVAFFLHIARTAHL